MTLKGKPLGAAATGAKPVEQLSPAPRQGFLGQVTRGIIETPWRVLLYGVDGIGKTTFMAQVPDLILAGPETGSARVVVNRLPTVTSFRMLRAVLRELLEEEHSYKAFGLDTLDWLEPMIWDECCKEGAESSIEGFGYGKGYVFALDKWRILIADLELLWRKKGMAIYLGAHALVKPFNNPEGPNFDRYELAIHAKAAGLFKQWVDVVAFANFKTIVDAKKGKAPKGTGGKARVLYTSRTAAFDAKDRYGLPAEMPFSYEDFEAAMKRGVPAEPEALRAAITARSQELPEDKRAAVTEAMNEAKSPQRLAMIYDRVMAILEENAEGKGGDNATEGGR